MTKIRFIAEINRYFLLFEDGSKGWCSQRGVEDLFPGRAWDIVKKYDRWFYL